MVAKERYRLCEIMEKKDDYSTIYIDFAPIGSFEAFMKGEPIPQDDTE
jgi:hypothetical protein